MHVTGGADRLSELFSEADYLPVYVLKIVLGVDIVFLLQEKGIISQGLDLQIVIEPDYSCDLFLCPSVFQCPIQFSRLTGAAQDQSLPALRQK